MAIRLLADKLPDPRPFARDCMILGYPRAEELANSDRAVDLISLEAALVDAERIRIVDKVIELYSFFTGEGVWP